MEKKEIESVVGWYKKERPRYKLLAKKVETLIKEILDEKQLSYHIITSRAKDVKSFREKANLNKYKDPKTEIKDLAGIRVITFVKSEVEACCEAITPLFKIDKDHSVDKTKELGNDKVGYRSIHYVAELTDERVELPENKTFKGMCFEIQIRTILEHAWADISHDRNYKFQGVLPEDRDIDRRFSLLAATLELVDREFNTIAREIDEYAQSTELMIKSGKLDIRLDTTSLREYILIKFSRQIQDGKLDTDFRGSEAVIVTELQDFGIGNLEEINSLIDEYNFAIENNSNFIGLLRDVMILSDADHYFENAWNNHWGFMNKEVAEYYKSHGVSIEELSDEYDFIIEGYDFDFDDDDF